jgi:glyoxylase-like metal-dependent hydrolase (beta-lactamase superfamily II)
LFAGSIGRSDLPGGNTRQLLDGIDRHLLTLPDETRVLSGHGPATTIARERSSNPFIE